MARKNGPVCFYSKYVLKPPRRNCINFGVFQQRLILSTTFEGFSRNFQRMVAPPREDTKDSKTMRKKTERVCLITKLKFLALLFSIDSLSDATLLVSI